MTRILVRSLLAASLIVAAWASTSEACHRRRKAAAQPVCYAATQSYAGYASPSPTGQYDPSGGYAAPAAGAAYPAGAYPDAAYPGGAYPGGAYPGGGYDLGRPGYNPGGLGGPASGIGVRPGLGAGGFGPGR
ncbi:hypothetical protein [Paludisphaera mucosa]|uniref:Uncharacterized protein n=1 Tax=Paludisphaera mucosa TaxID=3030827 RepID=A0ABT6FL14_9BACT|nr:hypothetical protein [Paludisphaera mucosa]MDG3008204.1 hypothetical protein [Paludisphaera mucosa]